MYGCESWAIKLSTEELMLLNCGVREDSWKSLKEITPVNRKGNQSWIFTGRTDAEAETPVHLKIQYFGHLTHWKRPWCWERLKAGGEADDRGWDGWMASPTQWTWVWVNSGSWWWTGRLACWGPWGHKESDTTEGLNWTELRLMQVYSSLNILWHCLSLGLEWKQTFSIPVATAEFSKFAGILSAALSQHHPLGFEITQLEFFTSTSFVCSDAS